MLVVPYNVQVTQDNVKINKLIKALKTALSLDRAAFILIL